MNEGREALVSPARPTRKAAVADTAEAWYGLTREEATLRAGLMIDTKEQNRTLAKNGAAGKKSVAHLGKVASLGVHRSLCRLTPAPPPPVAHLLQPLLHAIYST
jgi:hypothetical protein